jgi:hypothetical protein
VSGAITGSTNCVRNDMVAFNVKGARCGYLCSMRKCRWVPRLDNDHTSEMVSSLEVLCGSEYMSEKEGARFPGKCGSKE